MVKSPYEWKILQRDEKTTVEQKNNFINHYSIFDIIRKYIKSSDLFQQFI